MGLLSSSSCSWALVQRELRRPSPNDNENRKKEHGYDRRGVFMATRLINADSNRQQRKSTGSQENKNIRRPKIDWNHQAQRSNYLQ